MRLVGALLSLLSGALPVGLGLGWLAHLAGGAGPASATDLDDDGYDDVAAGGDDCDDADAEVHPGAAEVFYDGVDQDCSGGSDYDADGDGFHAEVAGGTDCDDGDPEVHLYAAEVYYDGVDGDCDGADDYDQDGDGVEAASGGGDDCDDEDERTYPGAPEVCRDGRVNDCDGDADAASAACLWSGDVDLGAVAEGVAAMVGDLFGDQAGASLASAGDVDGDGRPDLLIGATSSDRLVSGGGATYVVPASLDDEGALSDLASAVLAGAEDSEQSGAAVSGAGDLDGDGYADLLVSAVQHDGGLGNSGAVYVVQGPVSGELALPAGGYTIQGDEYGGELGDAVAGAGDVDGDGSPDLLLGSEDSDAVVSNGGRAFLFLGPLDADHSVDDAEAELSGSKDCKAGHALASVGDQDGDGLADVLVGAVGATTSTTFKKGAVYLLEGPVSGAVALSDSTATFVAEGSSDHVGSGVAGPGDVDGDGYDDVLIGAYGASYGGLSVGVAYVVLGPSSGSVSLSGAHARLVGEEKSDKAGVSVAAGGDLDADGAPDLLVGATAAGDSSEGAIYVVLSPVSGTSELASAGALRGPESSAAIYLGVSVDDVGGDGLPELLTGQASSDLGAASAGAAWLVSSEGW